MDRDITLTDADADAYEVLRRRLGEQADELVTAGRGAQRAADRGVRVDRARLLATEQVHTEHASVARDLVAVGGRLLFGFERGPGARGDAGVGDVARPPRAGPARAPRAGHGAAGAGLLDDAAECGAGWPTTAFVREFAGLHRYFRDARLLRLRSVNGRLLAVFRTGETAEDIRVLRWALGPDGRPGPSWTPGATATTSSLPRTTSTGRPRAGTPTCPAGTRTSPSLGAVFVDTLGGTLTVKAEDDTEIPRGDPRGARRRAAAVPGGRRRRVRARPGR